MLVGHGPHPARFSGSGSGVTIKGQALSSSFDLSGTLPDIVNYALSLDIAGKLPIIDAHGHVGWLLFADRRLRNVWLGERSGEAALQVLASGSQINCNFDPKPGDADGPLCLDYEGLQKVLSSLQQAGSEPAGREPARLSPASVANPVESGTRFPRVPTDLFPNDRDVLLFGVIMGARAQVHAANMPEGRVQNPAAILKQILKFARDTQEIAGLLPAADSSETILKLIVEIPGYLLGISQEKDMPWTLFVVCRKPEYLGHTFLLARLDALHQHVHGNLEEHA